jgi:hypothetical protein
MFFNGGGRAGNPTRPTIHSKAPLTDQEAESVGMSVELAVPVSTAGMSVAGVSVATAVVTASSGFLGQPAKVRNSAAAIIAVAVFMENFPLQYRYVSHPAPAFWYINQSARQSILLPVRDVFVVVLSPIVVLDLLRKSVARRRHGIAACLSRT